jgi:uncharacterized membrane protein
VNDLPVSHKKPSRPLRTLIAGMLAALPLLATLWLLTFAFDFLIGWFGPESRMGRLLNFLGLNVAGHEWSGYVIGLAVALFLLFILGLLVERGLSAWLVSLVDAVVGRIPIVRTVYETIEKFVEVFSQRDESKFKSMRPVWCHFGGVGGVSALALLSSPEKIMVNGEPCYALIVPTAPVPIGGGLLFVPIAWVTLADIGMEALTSIYVSMGVTSPQFLSVQPVPEKRL